MHRLNRVTLRLLIAPTILAAFLVVYAGGPTIERIVRADATDPDAITAFYPPPPGGLTVGPATVEDPVELARHLPFRVASIAAFDLVGQRFHIYIPGAPSAVNTLTHDVLGPETIVWVRRAANDTSEIRMDSTMQALTGATVPEGSPGRLPVPPRGGLTLGVAGTSSIEELVQAQDFEPAIVAFFEPRAQRTLIYTPGAPSAVNRLAQSIPLSPDTVVWMRRSLTDSRFAAELTGTPGQVVLASVPAGSLPSEQAPSAAAATPPSVVVAGPPPTGVGGGGASSAPSAASSATPTPTPTVSAPTVASTSTPTPSPTARASTPSPTPSPTPTAPPSTSTPTPSPTPSPTATPTVVVAGPPPGTRDPFLWPFSSQSPWNMPLGSGAQFAGSSHPMTINLHSGSYGINASVWSHPIYLASSSDPVRDIVERGSVITSIPVPNNAEPALPSLAELSSADAHLHIVSPDHRTLHELYATQRDSNGNLLTRRHEVIDLFGSGIAASRGQSIGVRAYGGSAVAGLIRRWEVEQGQIRHALAIALDTSLLKMGPVWPATTEDRTAQTNYHGTIPMGSLIGIPADVDLNSLGLSSGGMVLARALQDYGAYVTDAAQGGVKFYAEPSASSLLGGMRGDLSKIGPLLQPVLNNSASNVGGGGTPRAPLAPALVAP
ncbi:MAG: hypothetical protein R3C39_05275 [Dehalococcoidia bacterium]